MTVVRAHTFDFRSLGLGLAAAPRDLYSSIIVHVKVQEFVFVAFAGSNDTMGDQNV